MANKDEFILKLERERLKGIRDFIKNQEKKFEKEIKELEEKTDALFKKSGGTYSQEYELSYEMLNYKKNKKQSYGESLDTPYFGRIDFRLKKQLDDEVYYIGKHSVSDFENTEELVIDWRAPIADLYYSSTKGEAEVITPGGLLQGELNLKRRFTYEDKKEGDIDRIFDEGDQIILASQNGDSTLADEFLQYNLEKSRSEKLKDIVATIAKEQNEIIRAPKNIPIIVQGSAGAGKTTVALHRLAYLLYRYKDTLKGSDVCILAPNNLFIDYISEVLPNLGTEDVVQTTLEDIIKKELKIRKYSLNKDDILKKILEKDGEEGVLKRVSKLKGTLRYLELVNYIVDNYEKENEFTDLEVNGHTLYNKEELSRLFFKDLVYLPMSKRMEDMEKYANRNLKIRMEEVSNEINKECDKKIKIFKNMFSQDESLRKKLIEIYDDRDLKLKNLSKDSKLSIKNYFKERKLLDASTIYQKYITDVENIEKFFMDENDVVKKQLSLYDKKNVTSDDLTALMFIHIKVHGMNKKFSHIVVDEAQDYSLMQFELIRNMVNNDSLTLAGDLAQGIYSFRSISSWESVGELFDNRYTKYLLRKSYRSTIEIIEESNKILRNMNTKVLKAIGVLRHGEKVKHIDYKNEEDLVINIRDILKHVKETGRKTTAIVVKTMSKANKIHKLLKNNDIEFTLIGEDVKSEKLNQVVMASYLTKGLEFDCVVIIDEDDYKDHEENQRDELDLKINYVVRTRALHLEYVLNKRN